tara:strand:+ start:372 stop:575 length:204 start_codon:yes stop_codon:yes gene_type:complete
MDFPKNMNFEQTSLNKLKILASVGQYVIGQALSQGEEWEKVGLTKKFADQSLSVHDYYLLKYLDKKD